MQFQLPDMVRLVGKINGEDRVYVEDYVYTYLHELKSEDEKFPIRVALFGHAYQNEGRKFYMVYGAASVVDELENGKDEELVRREFFEEYELIGYVNIYGKKQEWPGKKNGYYIFYETNEPMQNYLIARFERTKRRFVPVEKASFSVGEAIRKFFYGACIVFLVIAVTAINDYHKMCGFVETIDQAVMMEKER